jgi:AcrR family transcriptional regulator
MPKGVDGRVQRAERSRQAIVRAMIDLVGRGDLAPTARQVADEAGVAIRSVFRHFSDVEALYRAMDAQLEQSVAHLVAIPPAQGALATRVTALVRQRSMLFERIAPYKRSADTQRRGSAFLQERHRYLQRRLRDDLLARLPELVRAPADLVAAADLATSFEAWDRLRGDMGLSPRAATVAIERTVRALLASRRY